MTTPIPTTITIPTLLSIEQSWIGIPPTTQPHDLLKSEKGVVTFRTINDVRVVELLRNVVAVPYALVDETSRIVCISGRNKMGDVQRIYDLVALHTCASPDDDIIEKYTPEYVRLIVERSKYHRRWCYISIDEEDPKKRQEEMKLIDNAVKHWTLAEVIAYMNRYYAFIADTKSYVIEKHIALHTRNGNSRCVIKLKTYNRDAFIPLYPIELPGEKLPNTVLWYNSEKKRTYHGVVFGDGRDDSSFNFWRGLRPIPAGVDDNDAEPFFQHLYHVFCNGNEELYDYLVYLFAHYVQKPLVRTEICLVLKGRQGSGKGYVFDGIFRHIFGENYVNTKLDHIERFDYCLMKCVLLFLDETTPEWNKKTRSRVKALVTTPVHQLEEKFLPRREFESHINVIMATTMIGVHPLSMMIVDTLFWNSLMIDVS